MSQGDNPFDTLEPILKDLREVTEAIREELKIEQ